MTTLSHGHTKGRRFSPTYHSWASMLQRCTNPKNKEWARYGGRSIRVCRRWGKFENFLKDMGERPAGATLDRKNNNRGYSRSNCRWASAEQQSRNRRNIVHVEIEGRTQQLQKWCSELGISINTVRDRVKFHGYTYRGALTTPVKDTRFGR